LRACRAYTSSARALSRRYRLGFGFVAVTMMPAGATWFTTSASFKTASSMALMTGSDAPMNRSTPNFPPFGRDRTPPAARPGCDQSRRGTGGCLGGVCDLTDAATRRQVMRDFPVDDVWGVGRATTAKLAAFGVTTAGQLRDLDAKQARQLGTVVLERTVRELRGEPCLQLEDVAPQRKGIACTRSFGRVVTDLEELLEAMASHATRAGEKLLSAFSIPRRTAAIRSIMVRAQHGWCR
jgi:hypothetical protein